MMKFRIYIFLLVFPVLFSSCSEEITDLQSKTFIKLYGSYQNDAGKDVKALASGGYAFTGNIVPDSVAKMFLVLTDEAGNQLEGFPKWYGGDYQTGGNSILVLNDGYLLGGHLLDTAADGELRSDMFLVRTDAEGTELWSKTYGNEENDDLFHVIEKAGGGFVLAGKKSTNEDEDLWIIMVDENGEEIFDFTGSAVGDDDEANFLIGVGDGYLCACTYDEGEMDGTDIFLVSLDQNCNILDSRALGTDFDDIARSIVRYNDGYLVMGYTENTQTGLSEISLYTFKMVNGLIQNTEKLATISRPGTDLIGEACVINSLGEIMVFGTRTVNENRDMCIIRIGSDGQLIGDLIVYGELGNQIGNGMDKTADGGLILVGTHTLEGNSLISLIKTDARGSTKVN